MQYGFMPGKGTTVHSLANAKEVIRKEERPVFHFCDFCRLRKSFRQSAQEGGRVGTEKGWDRRVDYPCGDGNV